MRARQCWEVGDTLSDAARMSIAERVRLIEALIVSIDPEDREEALVNVRQILNPPRRVQTSAAPRSIAPAGYHRWIHAIRATRTEWAIRAFCVFAFAAAAFVTALTLGFCLP